MKIKYPIPPVIKGRQMVYPSRNNHCLWCGLNLDLTNDMRRKSFCTNEHRDLYDGKWDWPGKIRWRIFERDKGTCVQCGLSEQDTFPEETKGLKFWDIPKWEAKKWPKFGRRPNMEVDHIIPIAMGGDQFEDENLQLLCELCHREKTKKDLRDITRFKKGQKGESLDKYFS